MRSVSHVYAVERLSDPLEPGRTYSVVVNDQVITSLTIPDPELGDSLHCRLTDRECRSQSRWRTTLLSTALHVISGMPKGSGMLAVQRVPDSEAPASTGSRWQSLTTKLPIRP